MATDKRLDDAELVERLRDPSTTRAAFGDLIRLYTEPLYRQIRRMVQNHDDTDDILQNSFLKAWQNIENFRGDAKLSTWLYKIAINESLSHLERERKRQGLSLDDQESAIVNLIEADDEIDGDLLARELRKAIAALPEKQRLVFNMRYYDDMKYEQMSEILGTSVGALKSSYHLAVKKIEQYFSEME
ncbi:MAG: sigma-70 family RNA polymerase sigma factor [Bacteroides sp.]|nr:sigma-70 family RNA polymerase sigma factor [Bacteroides sp.]MBD5332280.1 sigma-70 family RNA polymerase sigma factor [Bacteroides sp.]